MIRIQISNICAYEFYNEMQEGYININIQLYCIELSLENKYHSMGAFNDFTRLEQDRN